MRLQSCRDEGACASAVISVISGRFRGLYKCYVSNNGKEKLSTFQAKADEAIFLGYSSVSKAFKVFNKSTLKMEESIHVKFSETQADFKEHSDEQLEHRLQNLLIYDDSLFVQELWEDSHSAGTSDQPTVRQAETTHQAEGVKTPETEVHEVVQPNTEVVQPEPIDDAHSQQQGDDHTASMQTAVNQCTETCVNFYLWSLYDTVIDHSID